MTRTPPLFLASLLSVTLFVPPHYQLDRFLTSRTPFALQIFPSHVQMNATQSSDSSLTHSTFQFPYKIPSSFLQIPFLQRKNNFETKVSLSLFSIHPPLMVPELEKPRIIEIQVRMDCNGCIHKIKKALQGINGIYEHYIDFPQQKITVVGWADPEKIVKAIKKTRKIATICAHSEPTDPPAQPTEPAPADAQNPPPADQSPPTEAAPPTEPPKDSPPPENPTPTPEVAPSAVATDAAEAQQPVQVQPSETKDVEEIHVIHHHPRDYGYGYGYGYDGHWNGYPNGYGFRHEAPVYVTHSYNTYKPSPYITEYEYVRSPPRHTRYSRVEHYGEDYQSRGNTAGNNITSMFSDENPNACRIV